MGATLGICIVGSFGAGIGMAVKNGTTFKDNTSQADILKSVRSLAFLSGRRSAHTSPSRCET